MATEVHQFTITIPGNTQMNNLYSETLELDYRIWESIDLEVPPGPMGLMGFYIAHSGVQIIPMEVGEFIVWDDRADSWFIEEYPSTQGWMIYGYNLDVYPHSLVIRPHVDVPSSITAASNPTVTIVNGAIESGVTILQ